MLRHVWRERLGEWACWCGERDATSAAHLQEGASGGHQFERDLFGTKRRDCWALEKLHIVLPMLRWLLWSALAQITIPPSLLSIPDERIGHLDLPVTADVRCCCCAAIRSLMNEGEARAAAEVCFGAWLISHGGTEPAEVRDGIKAIRAFLSAHGTSRFLAAWEEEKSDKIVNLAGFRRKVETSDGSSWDYFVTTEAWAEATAGFDARSLAAVLAKRGLLLLPEQGPHRAKSLHVPSHGRRRVYHLPAKIMETEND
jgi:hypothetical protein